MADRLYVQGLSVLECSDPNKIMLKLAEMSSYINKLMNENDKYGVNYYPDHNESDQGATAAGAGETIYDIITSVGVSEYANIVLSHNGDSDTTTYTLDTSIDLTLYPYVTIEIQQGAVLARTTGDELLTLYSPTSLVANQKQKVTSAAMLSFSEGGWVYPEWWGALGNGTTDDRTAIQNAINTGMNVHFGKKTYMISESIDIDTEYDVIYEGESYKAIYETTTGSCIRKTTAFSDTAAIIIDGSGAEADSKNILIRDILIDGNDDSSGATGGGVIIESGTSVRFENVSIENHAGIGLTINSCWFTTIDSCNVRKNDLGGLYICSTNRVENLGRFYDVTVSNNGVFQLKIEETGNTVISNRFINCIFELPQDDTNLVNLVTCTDTSFYGCNFPVVADADHSAILLGTAALRPINVRIENCYLQSSNTIDQAPTIEIVGVDGLYLGANSWAGVASGQYEIDCDGAGTISGVNLVDPFGDILLLSGKILDTSDVIGPLYISQHVKIGNDITENLEFLAWPAITNIRSNTEGVDLRLTSTNSSGSQKYIALGKGTDGDVTLFETSFPACSALAAAPSNPYTGMIVRADRTTWDPKAIGSGGSYYVWYNGSAWKYMQEQ